MTDENVVTARSLLLLDGMDGVSWNGARVRHGPELVEAHGVEWVVFWTGNSEDPEAFTRVLLRADVRIDLGPVS